MAPTFSKPAESGALSNNIYSIVVPATVSKVTIKASAISKYTTVSGTGTFNLNAAGKTTTFTVTGTAQNGTKQTYKVNVTRKDK